MRVLITGVAGFIGSHLADRLLHQRHQVSGVDNLETGVDDNVAVGVNFKLGDITDRQELYELANECQPELVIHCAASYKNPDRWHQDVDTNTAGTINAVLAARHHKAKLVYFQTALPPTSSYAISKHAGEQYINLSGVPSLVFRLANVYGPRNLSGPIPTFYKRLTAGEACTVVDTRRDLVYISDLVDLVLKAVTEKTEGRFDVCSGKPLAIRSLFFHVAEAVGSHAHPAQRPRPDDDVVQMDLDPFRAKDELGWTPTTPVRDGIEKAVAWYQDHGVQDTYTHLTMKG